jgi:hypothetical protein
MAKSLALCCLVLMLVSEQASGAIVHRDKLS